ncbi:hypothetical protein F3157_04045 [Virgibacillus dakarensis]|uniref:Uncharacterized protein n=1 Tax=Lentibacillus populi TaxID=1827502 RepID=A0A9W5TUU9_9BACI|nr:MULTISPECIES: hypothetical protein [Bacillaceae]MBT2214955.1 hypothetical protein [Virgibacillus dakarensis]MTW84829.1 hypothetical protein [Virgibacillus dakarensis]GGB31481.1 hypothetical protein GCM10011409_06100 [Lentibacillus populi]
MVEVYGSIRHHNRLFGDVFCRANTIDQGNLVGGFVALGAILLGDNVLETNGKRITTLKLIIN